MITNNNNKKGQPRVDSLAGTQMVVNSHHSRKASIHSTQIVLAKQLSIRYPLLRLQQLTPVCAFHFREFTTAHSTEHYPSERSPQRTAASQIHT
jgi:hypothetical protein